jgi:hypothetical protein
MTGAATVTALIAAADRGGAADLRAAAGDAADAKKPSHAAMFRRELGAHGTHTFAMARLTGLCALVGYAFKTLTMDKATRLLTLRRGADFAAITLLFADATADAG